MPHTPTFVQIHRDDDTAVRAELIAGITAASATIAPKFLYDPLGSRLFEAVTEVPEYYPTRTEAAILRLHGDAIAAAVPTGATLVDLGAGNCEKARSLFARLAPAKYVAVDISVEFLRQALAQIQASHPRLEIVGVGLDFSTSLSLPVEAKAAPGSAPLMFYPGSSIGNFSPEAAATFLRSVRNACAGGGLLIGVDLVKGAAELEAAYDDALGVTAAFNRNLLLNANRIAGCDFRLEDWRHLARYDEPGSRIEMYLEAPRGANVTWPGGKRRFAAGERIHTENSYKWTTDRFAALLESCGFSPPTAWTDPDHRFAVMWAPSRHARA